MSRQPKNSRLAGLIRVYDWWAYKIPPMILMLYLLAWMGNETMARTAAVSLFGLLMLCVGAVYTSLINDAADREEDIAAGKKNTLSTLSHRRRRMVLLLASVAALVSCGLVYRFSSLQAFLFYALAYVCNMLYSLRPIRLKRLPVVGVLADACGEQMFPTLFVAALAQHFFVQGGGTKLWALTAVWSLSFGLRNILYHQCRDLEQDKKIGARTLPIRYGLSVMRRLGWSFIWVELFAWAALVFVTGAWFLVWGVVLYLPYLLRLKKLGVSIVPILAPAAGPYHVLNGELYQVFLPTVLLIALLRQGYPFLALMLVHAALFWGGFFRVYRMSLLYPLMHRAGRKLGWRT